MIEKYYQIGGMVLKVSADERELYACNDLLAPFSVKKTEHQWEYHVRFVDELPVPTGSCIYAGAIRRVFTADDGFYIYIGSVAETERDAYVFLHRRSGETEVQVKRSAASTRIGEKTVLRAMELEHLLAINNALLLHASCISIDGGAILFTAPSGYGKSTQAALWEKLRGASIINGDRIIVRMDEEEYKAWGVPYSGTSGICKQARLPIKAVVCLKQAPDTSVRRINGVYAFRQIWEGCTMQLWDQQDVNSSISCVLDLINRVPIYELCCTPDESAVMALENAMKGEQGG